MSKRFINGNDFTAMAALGADYLQRNVERVNALNVFPVPDGDTGTNMNLTLQSGMRELHAKPSAHLGKAAEALSKGLLMGARGNSGVILSQIFRGFSKSLQSLEQADPVQFAAAMQSGVDTAYKAVVKPIEGTILTVAREAAKHAVQYARRAADLNDLMQEVYAKAHETLQRTPDMLPVLKQVGVVDSGGQGLLLIYEGFMHWLAGSAVSASAGAEAAAPAAVLKGSAPAAAVIRKQAPASAQSRLSTEAIEFLYDMEFFINRTLGGSSASFFNESAFRNELAKDGDSIIVISDEDTVKVHVHSRKPGDVLNLALQYGELMDIRILNMREQHRDLLAAEQSGEHESIEGPYELPHEEFSPAELLAGSVQAVPPGQVHEWAPFGLIAVAMGEGLRTIFLGNGADIVLSGGQTMNPSAEDFVNAIEALPAEHVFILPNNGNIVLAAEQAASLCERKVTVIPTKTIPQGLAALLAFQEEQPAERNEEFMINAAKQVISGQVTHAVRDTSIDGIDVKEGDYIAICEKKIVASEKQLLAACQTLIRSMMEGGGDLLTVLTGEDAGEADTKELAQWLGDVYPELEIEVINGGQPLYPYLFAIE
ncbi:DAK2 domain-containing protein [Paenibacillus protaetiae]|uniref:DAK2 domain-containing protein n=1 Tax=Paenibacillus protaetiae TaxID=2509456 RepID=A0A4P6ET12_9BACL|nr:DAK2 domain-containing protein [Paenibacillus protaetiae]QAY65535.1 DAK2 domain-containing protein [Paenibacillus protaetiae]